MQRLHGLLRGSSNVQTLNRPTCSSESRGHVQIQCFIFTYKVCIQLQLCLYYHKNKKQKYFFFLEIKLKIQIPYLSDYKAQGKSFHC